MTINEVVHRAHEYGANERGGEREKGRKQKRRRKMKKYSLATRMIANWLTMTAGFTAISNYP